MESRINYIKVVWLGANTPHIYFVSGPEALVSRRTNAMLSDFSSKIIAFIGYLCDSQRVWGNLKLLYILSSCRSKNVVVQPLCTF